VTRHGAPTAEAELSDYVRNVQEGRERARVALRSPISPLAAVARHPLPIGRTLRIAADETADLLLPGIDRAITVAALADGFLVDEEKQPPGIVEAGRYGIRLSHQNYPSVVILDRESPRLREPVELQWYAIEPSFRLHGELEPDVARQTIASTASGERPAERIGWARVSIGGVPCRLAVLRMLEPGFVPGHMDVYFRDATTGHGSYEVGRYVSVRLDGDGLLVDFNLAYNPACALSPYYNCPIPPRENFLTVAIRAGEMAPLDAVIVALIGVAVWNGYRSGFVATLYGLATWVVSFAAAVVFQQPAASLVQQLGLSPALSHPVAFVAVIVLVEGLFSLAGFFALSPVVKRLHGIRWVEETDKVLGVVPSVVRSLFVTGIVLSALVVSPVSNDLKAAVEQSRLARALIERVVAVQPSLAALSGQVGEQVPLFVTKLGEDESQKLDLPDNLVLTPDAAAEKQMFDLVNDERANVGLKALVWDDRLVPIARQHSEEMFKLKYFAHQSPVTGSPFDRLKAGGVTYTRAGENLAYAQSVTVAMRGLMQSQGHRENILRPEFTRIGIGVISAGAYGRMFTQMFVTP